MRQSVRTAGVRTYRNYVKPLFPRRIAPVLSAALRAGVWAWHERSMPHGRQEGLTLDGVVYTSIFNPEDGRKNWEDMITAFLQALGDCEDATLVLKLIAENRQGIHRILSFYRRLDISHRCRLVLIPDFLSEADMQALMRSTTYYLTTTRAEGNCLPLMNYLSAGRPGVSPSHTAIADYFGPEVGFVIDSHPEPCAWTQDSSLRWRSTWHRLVWTSLVEQIRHSYEIAKNDRAMYRAMGDAARDRMRLWSHPEAVWPHLRSALDLLHTESKPLPVQIADDEPRESVPFNRRSAGQLPSAAPMRVVVSLLNFRPGQIGGTETYLRQLIARLPVSDRRHEIVLLMDRDLAEEAIFPGMERAVIDMNAQQVLRARWLEAISPYRARSVEKALERLRPDVVFFPQQSIFPKHVAAPCVLVVHDLYHLFLPQYLSRGQRIFRQRSYAYSLSRADRIIAISQFTKKTILQKYDVDAQRIDVVPHGWEPTDIGPIESDGTIAGKYIYFPAITRPHKNHHVLLDSIAALKSQGRFEGQLVLSGIQTPHWQTLCRQIKRLKLEETVMHKGYVSYPRVRQLYHGADCVVFPSSFEGFGLPVMEAFEAHKKILVSRLELFNELGVPKRFQIDFSDPEQLYQGLQEPGVATLETRPWTWDESASATMQLLCSAAGREAAPMPTLIRAA